MTMNLSRAASAHLGVLFALVLGGCGGGGDAPVPPPPPPPAPEAAYVVAAVAQSPGVLDAPQFAVRVFDPAHPAAELLHDDIEAAPGASGTAVVNAVETAWDPATRTVTTLGHARAFYTNHGQLWAIDLRGDHDHTPRRIGTVDSLCPPFGAYTLSRDGQDAWIQLAKSVGGVCADVIAVRADGDMAGTVAPFPSDTLALQAVESADGRFGGLLGSLPDELQTTQTFWFADAATLQWTLLGSGPYPTGQFLASIAPDPAQPAAGYLGLRGGIFAVSWSDSGLAVGAQVAAVDAPAAMVVGDGTLHFGDGANYLALGAGGSPTVLATAPAGDAFHAVRVTDSGLVLGMRGDGDYFDGTTAVGVFDAASASFTQLSLAGVRLAGPAGGRGDVTLLGAVDLTVGDAGFARHAASGVVEALPRALLVVNAGTHEPGAQPDVAGTLQCERTVSPSGAALVFCGGGAVDEEDLVTRVSTPLGELPADALLVAGPELVEGVATVLEIQTSAPGQAPVTDLFLVVPGQAHSLVRLTNGGA